MGFRGPYILYMDSLEGSEVGRSNLKVASIYTGSLSSVVGRVYAMEELLCDLRPPSALSRQDKKSQPSCFFGPVTLREN